MSPNVRRALHEALDHVLDALAEDARAGGPPVKKAKRYRAPHVPDVSHLSPETLAKADLALRRAGLG